MDFYEVVDQAAKFLQQRGRLTYRSRKRQFDLNDDALEDLKDELLFSHPVVDEAGRGLVWTGDPAPPKPDAQHNADAESRFHVMLSAVMWWLQRERRVTYRALKHILGFDDALLEGIREELTLRRLAIDEEGKVLVWTGEDQPVTPPVVDVSIQPATADTTAVVSSLAASTLSPPITEPTMPSHGPTAPLETMSTDVPKDVASRHH
jgi:hypothetical protein